MFRKIIITIAAFSLLTSTVSAEPMLFIGEECPHCQELEAYLQLHDLTEDLTIYEIYHNQSNKDLYLQKTQELNYKAGAVPLLIDGKTYKEGTQQIISYIQGKTTTTGTTSISTEDSDLLNDVIKSEKSKTSPQTVILIVLLVGFGLFSSILALAKRYRA